jgi:hypothetical protein
MDKKIKFLIALAEKYRQIASEAIVLADEYAGGESETAKTLNKRFEKLEKSYFKTKEG